MLTLSALGCKFYCSEGWHKNFHSKSICREVNKILLFKSSHVNVPFNHNGKRSLGYHTIFSGTRFSCVIYNGPPLSPGPASLELIPGADALIHRSPFWTWSGFLRWGKTGFLRFRHSSREIGFHSAPVSSRCKISVVNTGSWKHQLRSAWIQDTSLKTIRANGLI